MAGLWLLVGLWVFASSRNRPALVASLATPLLTIYAIYLMAFLAEMAVGAAGITSPIPTLYQPGTKNYTYADPAVTPGVSGPKIFTINRLGLRGPLPPG